jgi:hypothetical protein
MDWIKEIDLKIIQDHLENTSDKMVKAYTIAQISIIDKINRNYVRNDPNYIPIRIDSTQARISSKKWYQVRYLRIKELEEYLGKKIKISFN